MALHIKSTTKFKILIGFSALSISGVAALFSVTGVSSLFAGAFWAIVFMMGILEFGKIVVASYLARFWPDLSKIVRAYFIAAVIILMGITSAGIFGYLSDAYQQTRGDYTVVEKQTELLKFKKQRFEQSISEYKSESKQLDDNISSIISAQRDNKIQFKDSTGQLITTQSSQTRKLYENQLSDMKNRKNVLIPKIDALSDSVASIEISVLELESKNITGELGPLKFVADIFGTTMDQVVKYLIFMLIFVFDPLAVLLFISLSMMIRKESEKEKIAGGNTQSTSDDVSIDYSDIKRDSKVIRELKSYTTNKNDAATLTHINEPVRSGISPQPQQLITSVEPVVEMSAIKITEVDDNIIQKPTISAETSTGVSVIENEVTASSEQPVEIPKAPPGHLPTPDWHTSGWRNH